jgi:hypothetical protein
MLMEFRRNPPTKLYGVTMENNLKLMGQLSYED